MVPTFSNYFVDASALLTQQEIDRVLVTLHEKAKTSKVAQGNLILFRLLTTLGLRISEALHIPMNSIRLDNDAPHVFVPSTIAKLGKARTVPIWSAQTIEELRTFKAMRIAMGAKENDAFFCSLSTGDSYGKLIARQVAGRRYKTIMRMALSDERAQELHPHSSRHTFISACLSRGVSLVETQRAAGHSSLSCTSLYSHLFKDRNTKVHSLD